MANGTTPTLFLFGRNLALNNVAGVWRIAQPAAYVSGWSGVLNPATGEVIVAANFAHDALQVMFSLTLRFAFNASSNTWLPQATQPTQPATSVFRIEPEAGFDPGAIGAIRIFFGPLTIREPAFNPSSFLGGGDLQLRCRPSLLTFTTDLPISIATAGLLSLALQDAGPIMALANGFLSAAFFAGRNVVMGDNLLPLRFFPIQMDSAAMPLSQLPVDGKLAFTFVPKAGDRLALHVEHLDRKQPPSAKNPLQAPLEADAFQIEIVLAAGRQKGVVISGATLHPGAGAGGPGPHILSHAYADRQNGSVRWQALQPMPLHVRPFTDKAPSTFLIAAADEADAVPLRCTANIIHGVTAESRFELPTLAAGQAHGKLVCVAGNAVTVPAGDLVDPALARDGSGPWIKIDVASTKLHVAKAGHAYTAGAIPDIVVHTFTPPAIGLPALPFEFTDCVDPDLTKAVHTAVSGVLTKPTYPLVASELETRMGEGPPSRNGSNVPLLEAFPLGGSQPTLDTYGLLRDFGLAGVIHTQPGNQDPDYVILTTGADIQSSVGLVFPLNEPDGPGGTGDIFKTGGKPNEAAGGAIGLIKLNPGRTLDQIFALEKTALSTVQPHSGNDLLELIHPDIRGAGWTGLMLFGQPLDMSGSQLRGIFPEGMTLAWVSITPRKGAQVGKFSVGGRIYWTNDTPNPDQGSPEDTEEVRVLPQKLDLGFLDGAITNCDARVDVFFARTFGLDHDSDENVTLELDGSYDRKSGTIRLVGNLSKPLELLPGGGSGNAGFGPFQSVQLTSAGVVRSSNGQNSVRLAGSIEFKGMEFGPFAFTPGQQPGDPGALIAFSNLDITVPSITTSLKWTWCSIGYPNINIDLSKRHFTLGDFGPFDLQLQSLGLGWDSVDWNRLLTIPSLDASKPDDPAIQARTFILGLRLDLMELPELADIDRIKLDFSLGFFPIGGLWSHTQLHGGLSAVGFHNFDVNLMRFLEVSADEVAIKRVSYTDTNGQSQPSTWLIFAGVRIIILGHVIVDGLVIEIFAAGDEKGFICYWPANTSLPANGILDIDWLLIGHNVEMPTGGTPPFWQTLISPEFDDPDDQIRKRLYQAVDQDKPLFLPRPGGSPTGAWIFAAGFEIFGGLLEGKFLFQDRAYYGIAIGGGLLDELFQGEDTGISVAYIKGASASDDAFAISVHVPTVVLAGFTFLGGVISVEISMGGSFMLDIGFPWLAPDGGREWDRTFGAIVSIGQGSGGGYIQKREIATASGDQLLLSGGYAIQGGLGASFNAAVVTAWVTAGFYAIFEGSVTFQNKQIIDVDVLGAIGILVRGGAELNWWIISVRIEIVASAEARGDLHWTKAQNVAMLQLDFELHVELGAQACIGGGWFKICRGISISLEMDFQQRIRIG